MGLAGWWEESSVSLSMTSIQRQGMVSQRQRDGEEMCECVFVSVCALTALSPGEARAFLLVGQGIPALQCLLLSRSGLTLALPLSEQCVRLLCAGLLTLWQK